MNDNVASLATGVLQGIQGYLGNQQAQTDKQNADVADIAKQKAGSSVVVFGASQENNAFVLVSVTDDLIKKGVLATDIVKTIAPLINGSGGGRPNLAQAGCKDPAKLAAMFGSLEKIAREALAV